MRWKLFSIITLLVLAACRPQATTPGAQNTPTGNPDATGTPAFYPAILPSPGVPGSYQPVACRFVLPEGLKQGQGVDCGYLTLPEQRETAGAGEGRVIRLAVAVFHPPGGAVHPDAVMYLSGGPGASALEMIRYGFDNLSKPVFAAGRDLVVFDQRGVGLSIPALDCPEFDQLSLDLLDRQIDGREVSGGEISDLLLDNLRACRDDLAGNADLTAYHSAASAADVNDLRQALGYEEVNLWGGSYGTRLALEVMRRYPQGLRSVVLDAVYPPDVDLYASAPANFHQALERLFAACATNPVCSEAYPELREVFFDTVKRLDEKPVLREIMNPFTGERYEAWMNGEMLLGLTFQLLYDSRLRFLLPQWIDAASQGDLSVFDQVRGALIGQMSLSSRGMMFSVQCHEELAFSSLKDFQTAVASYPQLAGMYENSILGELAYTTCKIWDAGQAEASANQPVASGIPTLVMSGEFDPVTPPEWGRRATETLENSFFFEYPGVGHGASVVEGCPQQMFIAFLQDPGSPPDDVCIQEMAK